MIKAIGVWLFLFLFWIVAMFVILSLTSCTQPIKANIPEKELVAHPDAQIIRAYAAILHRIWIDKPSYVEDVLVETDEFLELDELLSGDWEDTFEFWSKQDSLEYHLNWNHIDIITKIGKE